MKEVKILDSLSCSDIFMNLVAKTSSGSTTIGIHVDSEQLQIPILKMLTTRKKRSLPLVTA